MAKDKSEKKDKKKKEAKEVAETVEATEDVDMDHGEEVKARHVRLLPARSRNIWLAG